MSRILKQFLYGVFYVIVLVVAITVFYVWLLKPAPSCSNGIQDQNEQGIDCGGVCGNVCVAALQPVAPLGAWVFPNAAGHATILAEIANPNADAGVENLPYTINWYDASDTLLGSAPAAGFLYPSQTQYIALVNTDVSGVPVTATITIASSGVAWVSSSSMGAAPNFTFQNVGNDLTASGTVFTVNGVLVNQEPAAFLHVEVIAILKNSFGSPVGASVTMLNNVSANGSMPFAIMYPAVTNIDPTKTELEAYARP